MNSPFDNNALESSNYSWLTFLGRILPFMLFLVLAVAGMWVVYMLFSPSGGDAEVVAAVRRGGLSAPFFKAVPAKPVSQRLAQSPGPMRIGIISGHRGYDPGAVCDDGLTEAEVNLKIAEMVVANLRLRGIRTNLLDEFDGQLNGFSGTALVSIHADSCEYYNDAATGFKIAGSMAFRSGALHADPTLLEPVMKVEVVTPEDYLGDVMGDLNRRRGITHGMDDSPTGKVIQAEVPLAEMFGYATDLRSATQGRATYSMEFEKYSEAPTNIADAVIRKAS